MIEIELDAFLTAVTIIVDASKLDERGRPREVQVIEERLISFERMRPYLTDVPLARPERSPGLDD